MIETATTILRNMFVKLKFLSKVNPKFRTEAAGVIF